MEPLVNLACFTHHKPLDPWPLGFKMQATVGNDELINSSHFLQELSFMAIFLTEKQLQL